jgi:uncharacterized coiled-coil protein SlyX
MTGRTAWVVLSLALAVAGCPRRQSAGIPVVPPVATSPPAAEPLPAETVLVRDPELEQRVARLELQLLEKEAQLEGLQARLDEARREVVRSMARLQTLATRAEAASAMAEAEIALGTVRANGSEPAPDVGQARQLLEMSAAEFNKQNYAGALYLANQAKSLAGTVRGRPGRNAGSLRAGEVPFAVSVRLQALGQSNVREGPGTGFRVVFTTDRGTLLVGHSYAGEWVRVSDEGGRVGWIHRLLVGRRDEAR